MIYQQKDIAHHVPNHSTSTARTVPNSYGEKMSAPLSDVDALIVPLTGVCVLSFA